jgi:hypothetical protein
MAVDLAKPLIVTAEIGKDFGWLDDLRQRNFPPERNQLRAHLTMFHAVPPSAEQELRHILASFAGQPPPRAWIAGLMNLGGGVAFRIASDDLDSIRAEIAERLHGLLTAQDAAGWSAHITIQNKVLPRDAKALMLALGDRYDRRPVHLPALGLHRYLGGPWETLRTFAFRG